MALRINKKILLIAGIAIFVIVGGVGGYIAWRISQPEEVTPEEAAAGNCSGYDYQYDEDYCNDEKPDGNCCEVCKRKVYKNPNPPHDWCTENISGSCRDTGAGGDCAGGDDDPPPGGDDDPPGGSCQIGSGCNCCCDSYSGCGSGCNFSGVSCGAGQIAMCRDGCNGQCEQLTATHPCANCTDANSCNKSWSCPAGYHPVGSGSMSSPGSCSRVVEFQGWCDDCSNPVGCYGCCEPDGDSDSDSDDEENVCDTGSLDIPASGTEVGVGDTLNIAGWAGDSDGIDKSRIEVFVNGNRVGNASAVDACQNGVRDDLCGQPNPVSWNYNWTVPSEGNHDIYVRWFDTKGKGGSNCEGSTTVTGTDEPVYLQVQGRVFCQDENGPIYPIPNAAIQFYKHNAGVNEDMTTGEDGHFRSAANTTQLSDGGFAVRLVSIPDGGEIEETGALYADMEGPVLNTTICDQGTCNECGTSYEQCDGLSSGINYGFQWIYSNCGPPPNPDWDIDKVGTPVCYEEGTEAVYIDIEYVIEVTNVAEGGDLEYVRDEYDDRIQQDWILSTNPEASQITADYIQWDIPEGERTFAEGESRQYTYTVRIPLINNQDLLGEQLTNHAIAHLSEGEDLHAYEDILVGCGLPPTGLFDSAAARIALGGILLILGFGSYQMGFLDGVVNWMVSNGVNLKKKTRFALTQEGVRRRWENKAMEKIFGNRSEKKSKDED